ncbi:ABC transporter substrate-binding protein [Arvimicrobium flavum]|uniref:ABC transporter substrate-binding protein n=1 Tax=Arvimicrobium flavum TaxID=3393320 RepID=UPI00237B5BC3|nr:ABC transporter substrate-binding protein [Mesorhizobium shangrilense]
MTYRIARRSLLLGASSIATLTAFGSRPSLARLGGEITVVHNIEPRSLVGALGGGSTVAEHSAKLHDSLFFHNGTDIEPRLGTEVRNTADALEFTVRLQEGVTWHDGQPFTSADVAFTALEIWKPLSGNVAYRRIASVETPDDLTVVFKMSEPVSPEFFMNSISSGFGQVIPKHIYEGTDYHANPANKAPVGTGPFMFKEWKAGQYLIYERNPRYYRDGFPYADRILYRFEKSEANVAAVLESGEADVSVRNAVPLSDIERLKTMEGLSVTSEGNDAVAGFLHMELNTRREATGKSEVRQAIAHALDMRALIDIVYLGYARPVSGPLPNGSVYRKRGLPAYEFDPAKAEAMLDVAGYPRGANGIRLTLDFVCATWYPATRQAGDVVRQQLSDVGIETNLVTPDFGGMVTRVYKDYDYDIALSNSAHFSDPGLTTFDWYWSKAAIPGVPFRNTMGYMNPELDAAIETALSTGDADARRAAIDKFQDLAVQDLPLIPLAETTIFTVYRSDLQNVADNPQWSQTSWDNVGRDI